jgi:hypothetical protein
MKHPWIEGKISKKSSVAELTKYKASLSKTNDDIEDIENKGEKTESRAGGRQQKMREIDSYLNQRSR